MFMECQITKINLVSNLPVSQKADEGWVARHTGLRLANRCWRGMKRMKSVTSATHTARPSRKAHTFLEGSLIVTQLQKNSWLLPIR